MLRRGNASSAARMAGALLATEQQDRRDKSDEESSVGVSSSDDEVDESCSSSDDSDSACSIDEDDRSLSEGDSLYRRTNSTVRRRVVSPSNSVEHEEERHDDGDLRPRPHQRRRQRRTPNPVEECFRFYNERYPFLCNQRTNVILVVCFVIWFAVQFNDALKTPARIEDPAMRAVREHSADVRKRLRREMAKHEMAALREERRRESENALGFLGGAADQLDHWITGGSDKAKRKSAADRLKPGCMPTAWQTLSFPTCNDIHDLDLREELGLRKHIASDRNNTTFEPGYAGAGLWRTVWKIRGHGGIPLVLKMMKGEHEVDTRNLDRHRRDALAMERLTASPYVVSLYGYCGNTVLTEYLPHGLDSLVYQNEESEPLDTLATRETPMGRLRLALQVARGVAAIHEIPGGPIIHADIQAKQFLLDSQGLVKLNDFNRCRFMAYSTSTGAPCSVRIPTAPGSSRSPEEYREDELTEKIDVYSTANVFYAILTGEKHWGTLWSGQIKKLVKDGRKPPIEEKYLTLGTSDAALANLIDLAYELDPKARPQTSKLANELERLVALEEAKQVDN